MGLKEEEPQTVPGSSERPGRFLSLREDRSEALCLWVMNWFSGLMVAAGAKKTRSTSSSQVVPKGPKGPMERWNAGQAALRCAPPRGGLPRLEPGIFGI